VNRSILGYLVTGLVVLGLTVVTGPAETDGMAPPPESPNRPRDQTFLTYPEWFLVFSPAEYATHLESGAPASAFPYFGHLGQLWGSYRKVSAAAGSLELPFNTGYHVMIWVIGTSTTVEYALKSAYENTVGRVTEFTQGAPTDEDAFAARFARDYADFINVEPWYKYDFQSELGTLWRAPLLGPNVLRKWERKFILTCELLVKTVYGALIKRMTQASYEEPIPLTQIRLGEVPGEMPGLTVLERDADGGALVTVPRYQAFTDHARALAGQGATFKEIAGNDGLILLSALVPIGWSPADSADYDVLFSQPILTNPAQKRVAITTSVQGLGPVLRELEAAADSIEHVFDY
jgi:hypothetical protein